jgi:hypothetical protein
LRVGAGNAPARAVLHFTIRRFDLSVGLIDPSPSVSGGSGFCRGAVSAWRREPGTTAPGEAAAEPFTRNAATLPDIPDISERHRSWA